MEALAYTLIAILAAYLCHNVREIRRILKERSEERTEQRRAATRPRIYKEVHDSWTIDRNRRSLWSTLKK